MKLNGQTAVVTGATSGLGEAIALLFAQEGASVIAHGRNAKRGSALVERLTAFGVDAQFVRGDVGEPNDAKALADMARSKFGKIDVLVLNAGIADLGTGPFWEVPIDEFDTLWRTNVRGMWLCARACTPLVRDGGSIVAMGSTNSTVVKQGYAAYAATKGAVLQLARGMAADLIPRSVRVNVVAPGNCLTPMNAPFWEGPAGVESRAETERAIPLGRLGNAEEIAHAVLFFASGDSSYCTGASLAIDGGYTMV
jgi:NAD(P)-dependent dehydrogenase (short-subunit alcohol dehydrogenase family)